MRKHRSALVGAVVGFTALTSAVTQLSISDTPAPVGLVHIKAPASPIDSKSVLLAAPRTDPVHLLMEQLRTGDLLARQEAVEALGNLGTAALAAVPALKEAQAHSCLLFPVWIALKKITGSDPRPEFQGFYPQLGLLDLGTIRQQRRYENWEVIDGKRTIVRPSVLGLPVLIHALDSEDWETRIIAAESLAALGPFARPALDRLLAVLDDEWPLQVPEPPESPFAIRGIGGYVEPPRTYGVRAAATKALLAIGPAAEQRLLREGLPRLVAGLQRGSIHTRRHTAVAIGMIGPRAKNAIPALVAMLRYEDDREESRDRENFNTALIAIGPAAVPAITDLLLTESERIQERGLKLLARFGVQARSASGVVIPLLNHSSASIRCAAAETLTHLDVSEAIKHLSVSLMDSDAGMSNEAALLLRRIGPRARSAIPALMLVVIQRNDFVVEAAASAILRIEGPNEELITRMAQLRDVAEPPPWVDYVLKELGARATKAVPTLIRQLDDDRSEVRWSAAKLLCAIDATAAQSAIPVLRRIVEEGYPGGFPPQYSFVKFDRQEALLLLAHLRPPTHLDDWVMAKFLEKNNKKERPYLYCLFPFIKELGPKARGIAPTLRPLLEDERDMAWAAALLARVDPTDQDAVRVLTALLWNNGYLERFQAFDELAHLGSAAARAVPRLRQLLQDEDETMQVEASFVLFHITGEEPRPQIFRRALCFSENRNYWYSPYLSAIHRLGQLATDHEWAAMMLAREWRYASDEKRIVILRQLEDARPLDARAIPDIIALLRSAMNGKSTWNYTISKNTDPLRALKAFGPAAKEAAPVLQEALLMSDSSSGLVELVEQTLDAVQGTR